MADHEPTYNAANLIRQRRLAKHESVGLAPIGEPQAREGHAHAHGVGPKRVRYLRGLGSDLLAYCGILLAKRIKGREVEHQSPETDRYRAEMTERQHPKGDRGRRLVGWVGNEWLRRK